MLCRNRFVNLSGHWRDQFNEWALKGSKPFSGMVNNALQNACHGEEPNT